MAVKKEHQPAAVHIGDLDRAGLESGRLVRAGSVGASAAGDAVEFPQPGQELFGLSVRTGRGYRGCGRLRGGGVLQPFVVPLSLRVDIRKFPC